jgi:hypothetical protein
MEGNMAIVTKTIRGRQYYYSQHTTRVNGKPKSPSTYIGPVNPKRRGLNILGRLEDFITANFKIEEHIFDMEKLGREELERQREKATHKAAALHELHDKYGLVVGALVPTPIEKSVQDDAATAAEKAAGAKGSDHDAAPVAGEGNS